MTRWRAKKQAIEGGRIALDALRSCEFRDTTTIGEALGLTRQQVEWRLKHAIKFNLIDADRMYALWHEVNTKFGKAKEPMGWGRL